ncbi:MAG: hypothetical protein ACODAG_06115 [Myxococcota bacterium]
MPDDYKPTVCVDLDGVLNLYRGWKGEDHWPGPRPGAKAFIEALLEDGYEVVVFTTRSMMRTAMWLYTHQFPWEQLEVSNVKPPAVAYIDDRAILFRGNFPAALQQLRHFKAHWEPEDDRP